MLLMEHLRYMDCKCLCAGTQHLPSISLTPFGDLKCHE
jgi:hypothetical protein